MTIRRALNNLREAQKTAATAADNKDENGATCMKLSLPLKRKSAAYEDARRPTKKAMKTLQSMKQTPPLTPVDLPPHAKKCYVCKQPKVCTNPMCASCRATNDAMREAKADLTGRYAVVTGARIKIGFEIALRLLRDGCHVVATTRFPGDALKRYESEPDYADFKDRLSICALDMEDFSMVNAFLTYVENTLPHLDILVNNAAQTISRPAPYYDALYRSEAEFRQAMLTKEEASTSAVAPLQSRDSAPARDFKTLPAQTILGRSSNQALSVPPQQHPDFPVGEKDAHGEQIDLRSRNSWTYNLPEVPVAELLQVLAVNTVGPFLLTAKLKPMLLKSPHPSKFVVNVSAMEGQFSRKTKGHRHPHTNMAKAALNMMTRTSGLEFQMDGIYMTAVDTGWVTDERPFDQAAHETEKGFEPPLDCKDGAARVYHPILKGVNEPEKQPYFAVFLKDFRVHPW